MMRKLIIVIIIYLISLNVTVESRNNIAKNIIRNNIKQIKNYCTSYSLNLLNISNSTNCTLYKNSNKINLTDECIKLIIVRDNCIIDKKSEYCYGIIISLIMWITIPLCCRN